MIVEIQQTALLILLAFMFLSFAVNVNKWLNKKIIGGGFIDRWLWYLFVIDIVVAILSTGLRIWGWK